MGSSSKVSFVKSVFRKNLTPFWLKTLFDERHFFDEIHFFDERHLFDERRPIWQKTLFGERHHFWRKKLFTKEFLTKEIWRKKLLTKETFDELRIFLIDTICFKTYQLGIISGFSVWQKIAKRINFEYCNNFDKKFEIYYLNFQHRKFKP